MSHYQFTTRWRLTAPVSAVWKTLIEVERWPQWWRGVLSVQQLRAGDSEGLGAIYRQVWRSRLPYRLAFEVETVRVERERLIEGRARGELDGHGMWRLNAQEQATVVCYEWSVGTTRPWMNLLGPIARPVFAWNHHVVMGWGARGMARRLGAELIALEHAGI